MAFADPFLILFEPTSIPLMHVSGVNGTNTDSFEGCISLPCTFNSFLPNFTMLRPSGVSSAREDIKEASIKSSAFTPEAGINSVAILFPKVIVPVLSNKTTLTSPAASTALPLKAMTLCCSNRSIPAIPMAGRSAPMVVGIRHTRRAIKIAIGMVIPM